jgi:hypothetical protein
MDSKITVATTFDDVRPKHFDLLRHDPDISSVVAAVIDEAVVTQSVLQMAQ